MFEEGRRNMIVGRNDTVPPFRSTRKDRKPMQRSMFDGVFISCSRLHPVARSRRRFRRVFPRFRNLVRLLGASKNALSVFCSYFRQICGEYVPDFVTFFGIALASKPIPLRFQLRNISKKGYGRRFPNMFFFFYFL